MTPALHLVRVSEPGAQRSVRTAMRRCGLVCLPAIVAAAAVTASCATDTSREMRAETVVDTIGDTVVVRTVGATNEAYALDLVPEVTIGVPDGAEEYEFARIDEVTASEDGRVWVWDGVLRVLRQYDADGRFARQIGGRGGGPGEYESSNGIALISGGRLALWDARQARVNIYDTAGTYLTSWRADSPAWGPLGLYVDTAGGLYLRTPLREPRLPNTAADRETGLVEVDPSTGTPIRFLPAPEPALSPPRIAVMSPQGVPSAFASVPFAPHSTSSWSPLGYFLSARGDRYAVTLDREDRITRIERDVGPVRLDPEERRNAEERATAGMRRVDPSWSWSGPAIPEEKPLVRGLRTGAEGRVWVHRSMPGERIPESELGTPGASGAPPLRWREATGFDVFEPDGRMVGFIVVPPRATVTHSRGDRMWAVVRDSLDVPSVVRFRLVERMP